MMRTALKAIVFEKELAFCAFCGQQRCSRGGSQKQESLFDVREATLSLEGTQSAAAEN
jgi:hypothetical protein